MSASLSSDINRLSQASPSMSTVAHAVSASGASGQQPGKSGANARILVISAGEEPSEGYVSLMNCIFSAQKAVRRSAMSQRLAYC